MAAYRCVNGCGRVLNLKSYCGVVQKQEWGCPWSWARSSLFVAQDTP